MNKSMIQDFANEDIFASFDQICGYDTTRDLAGEYIEKDAEEAFKWFLNGIHWCKKRLEVESESQEVWCEWVATMIGAYLGEPVDSMKCKAIAGIISRRVWGFPKGKSTPVVWWNESTGGFHLSENSITEYERRNHKITTLIRL